uniref:Uncharacterized protein n=1 Tax=Anguilla anguilla TaxID=7936 RepID=A0A0E9VYS2_ANGAN
MKSYFTLSTVSVLN